MWPFYRWQKQGGQGESGDLDAPRCEALKWLREVVYEKLCGSIWAGFGRCNENEQKVVHGQKGYNRTTLEVKNQRCSAQLNTQKQSVWDINDNSVVWGLHIGEELCS